MYLYMVALCFGWSAVPIPTIPYVYPLRVVVFMVKCFFGFKLYLNGLERNVVYIAFSNQILPSIQWHFKNSSCLTSIGDLSFANWSGVIGRIVNFFIVSYSESES